jgi:hypothetical protein
MRGQRARLEEAPKTRRLTPAERELLLAAGPTYLDASRIETPQSSLAAAIDPDDWRLYHLMRELPQDDRARVLALAELLFNLHHAQRWAASRAIAASREADQLELSGE